MLGDFSNDDNAIVLDPTSGGVQPWSQLELHLGTFCRPPFKNMAQEQTGYVYGQAAAAETSSSFLGVG